jgi:hypothetical protein
VLYRRQLVVPVQMEEAFAYLSEFSSAAEWDPGVKRASMVTPRPVWRGSAFELDTVFLGNSVVLRYEIIEFDPPRRLALRAENRSVRSIDTISFSPATSSGTVVDYRAELTLKGLFKLAAPIFSLAFRRTGDRAADGLLATLSARSARAAQPSALDG